MLTIIVPTFNEMKNNIIQISFPLLARVDNCEIIIVDSNSTDGTIELARKNGFKIIQTNSMSRAIRLNLGIKQAISDMILLHHPRSILDIDGIDYLNRSSKLIWGAFTHKFNTDSTLLKFTSFYSNYIRAKRGTFYLDHCIFAKKEVLIKVGLLPEIDIFEDTEISKRLNSIASPTLLPFLSITSSVRFTQNGFWKQAILNQILKWKYYLNIDHKKMNKIYEKGLDLNSKYEDNNE